MSDSNKDGFDHCRRICVNDIILILLINLWPFFIDVVLNSLTEQCARYIEENASQCVQTEGWLELPKHTLTTILASENVGLYGPGGGVAFYWRYTLCIHLFLCSVCIRRRRYLAFSFDVG